MRVLIVDDHELIRVGVAELIRRQPEWDVCGEAGDAQAALQLATEQRPDLAIVDLRLENSDGLDLVKRLTAAFPETRILVSSMQDERLYAERALRAGARGYISKQESTRTLLAAIQHVLSGKVYLSPAMTDLLVARSASGGVSAIPQLSIESLSDRELEVFERLGQGSSVKEIAHQLHLSPKTIEYHRQRIKEKLQLDSSQAILRHATLHVLQKG